MLKPNPAPYRVRNLHENKSHVKLTEQQSSFASFTSSALSFLLVRVLLLPLEQLLLSVVHLLELFGEEFDVVETVVENGHLALHSESQLLQHSRLLLRRRPA